MLKGNEILRKLRGEMDFKFEQCTPISEVLEELNRKVKAGEYNAEELREIEKVMMGSED